MQLEGRYIKIYEWMLPLPLPERMVYADILSYSAEMPCLLTVKQFSDRHGLSIRSCGKAVMALIRAGLVVESYQCGRRRILRVVAVGEAVHTLWQAYQAKISGGGTRYRGGQKRKNCSFETVGFDAFETVDFDTFENVGFDTFETANFAHSKRQNLRFPIKIEQDRTLDRGKRPPNDVFVFKKNVYATGGEMAAGGDCVDVGGGMAGECHSAGGAGMAAGGECMGDGSGMAIGGECVDVGGGMAGECHSAGGAGMAAGGECHSVGGVEMAEAAADGGAVDAYGVLIEGWRRHWEACRGTPYVPCGGMFAMHSRGLLAAMQTSFARQGVAFTAEAVAETLDAFRSVADPWQLQHWDMSVVLRQFNQLYSKAYEQHNQKRPAGQLDDFDL